MSDNIPPENAEQAGANEIARGKSYDRGFRFVVFIAVANVLISLMGVITNFIVYDFFSFGSIVSVVIQLVISLALLSGISAVRYLLAANAALYAFMELISLVFVFIEMESQDPEIVQLISIIAFLIYYVICAMLLFFNRDINEYFKV